MTRETWLVARREIQQGSRARSFRITTVVMALAVAAAVIIPAVVSRKSTEHVGIIGIDPTATRLVQEAARIAKTDVSIVSVPDQASADAQLRAGTLNVVLVNGQEVLVKQVDPSGSSFADTLAQLGGLARLNVPLDQVALPVRGLIAPPRPLTTRLTGLIAAVLTYVVISVYGSRITVGVGEEKGNRVVEVLLATIRPGQLLIGKVIGLGTLALAQVAVLVVTFLVAGFATGSSAVHGNSAGVVGVGALWILAGYSFYCTAFAAAGSLVDRSSEAATVAVPLQLPILVAYVLSFTAISGTPSAFYRVLAFLPPTAPIANTVLYASGDATLWQVALALLFSAVATVGMARVAGVVYERAILQTGGRLHLRQVLGSSLL